MLNVEHERLDGCAAAPHARTAGAERPHDSQRAEAEAEADEEEKAEDEEDEDKDEAMLAGAAWLRDGSKDVQFRLSAASAGDITQIAREDTPWPPITNARVPGFFRFRADWSKTPTFSDWSTTSARGRVASRRAPGPALGISVGGRALPRVVHARDRRVRGAAS